MPIVGFLRPVAGPPVEGAAARPPTVGDGTQPSQHAGRASYVRPTPTPPAPRMVLDDADGGLGIDWARRAAQAVVAHSSFMDWADRSKSGERAESLGIDNATAVRAYGEFSGAEDAAVSPQKDG